jgi:hypothetical protein
MLLRVLIVIYFKDHIKQIRTPCDKNTGFLNVEEGGT